MTSQMPDPTMSGPTTPTPEQRDRNEAKSARRDAAHFANGTVQEVKDWVGDDRQRAAAALDVENQKDSPRATLVSHLEKLAPRADS